MLAIGGDYFGNAVNLGVPAWSRAAAPGQILASTDVRDELTDWAGDPAGSVDTQGFRLSGDGLRPAPVSLMIDLDALEAAGIANARERGALIEYLDGLGFTAEEMVEAERRGRLFGLAGDAVRRSGRPTYSLRTAAEALGLPLDDVACFWAALDLTVPPPRRRHAKWSPT